MEITDFMYSVLKIYGPVLDLILCIIFLSSILVCIITYKNRKKLKKMYLLLLIPAVLIVGTILYGSVIEQMVIIKKEQTIDIEDYNGDPIKFIIVSDLHLGQFLNTAKIPLLVNKINKIEDADYLLLLGDVVNDNSIHLSDLDFLKGIKKSTIFIYGNHDYENAEPPVKLVEGLPEKIDELGFLILENEMITVRSGGSEIKIAGIKDLWSHEEDFSFLDQISKEDSLILLSHSPDGVKKLDEEGYSSKVDLVLSGHTHGGEVRLPFIGPVGLLPIELPREYSKGLHGYAGIPLFITSGVGSTGTRVRLFNYPEIIVLTIM
ncbi:MAG: metallophosphoesterase [bacterium]